MIKIMDRSLWYYIKRPSFSLSLCQSDPPQRVYSLFVMDLIEQDLLEYRDFYAVGNTRNYGWYIKDTDQQIDQNKTLTFIDKILRKKRIRAADIEGIESSKRLIAKHLVALKGKND